MRILQVIESTAAGSGHQVLLSSSALIRRGVELAIVYSNIRADSRFLDELANITSRFPETPVRMIRMRHLPHPSDLRAIFALRRFVRDTGPFDVIHSHCTKAGFISRMAFPLSRRLHAYSPHAFMSMNPRHSRPVKALIACYERLISVLTETVIAVSSEEYQHAARIGISPEKLALVANGIDLEQLYRNDWALERAKYREALSLRDDQVCVGFMGRLAPQKDLATLLHALTAVRKIAHNEVILTIVGDGPDEPMLRRLASDLHIGESVRWTGKVGCPNIAAAFDIFALSSLYEGLPNSLLEAMALGLPCVVTNTGGARDLVRSGINGFVVPVSDVGTLASALSSLVANAGMRDDFGRASRDIVASFDIARTTDVMFDTLAVRHNSVPIATRSLCVGSNGITRRPLEDGETEPQVPLRILQLVESAATGVGRHVIDLTQELVDQGHHVHLIYSSSNIDARFESGLCHFAARCKATPMMMHHNIHVGDVALIRRLRRYMRKEGPFDVIHCHSSKAGLIGRLAAFGTGVPALYTPNALFTMNPTISPLRFGIARAIEVALAHCSACVIAVSKEEYDHARRLGIPTNRLAIVPNGVRRPRPCPDGVPRTPQGDPSTVRIGFIGRLAPQKAVDHLLKVLALMKGTPCGGIRPVLQIAGNGPLSEPLRAQCHALGLDDSVTWLGDVNGDVVLRQIDILAVPSDYEGFPYVMLEAMAAGLPIVSTDVGGATELVHPGLNGYVVPRRDASAFAGALARLAASPELRARMGDASYRIVQAFSIDQMANEIVALYHAAIQEQVGTRASHPVAQAEHLGHVER
jgi:glycosyltransferase involved in cell wall biosynthesis